MNTNISFAGFFSNVFSSNRTQKAPFAQTKPAQSIRAGEKLSPLPKDITSFNIKKERAKIKGFGAVAMGVTPFYVNNASAAFQAIQDFEDNEINHIRLQNEFVSAGMKPEYLPEVFKKITSLLPDFRPKSDEKKTDAIYRFIGKEEFDKLIEGKELSACDAYNGKAFDVTTVPTLNHNDFARVKFKQKAGDSEVELHDDMHEYYWLNKPSYSIDDVEEIARILPNGYIPVYSAK